jgi:glutamyl-tRNA synthetase
MKALFPLLRERSKTLLELIDNSIPFLSDGPPDLDPKAKKLLTDDARESLRRLNAELTHVSPWDSANLEDLIRRFADAEQVKLKEIAQPLRAALTGRIASPPIFDVMVVLGAHECVSRIEENTDLQATTKA